jgi:hypothetical protein
MKRSLLTLYVISFVVCLVVLAPPVVGQQGTPMSDFHEWEMRRDALNRVGADRQPPAARRRGGVAPQRRTEFKRIKVLNSELEQAASRDGALDLEFIIKSTAEMNKRAKRLMGSLSLSDPRGRPQPIRTKVEAEPNQLRSALVVLGKLITRFVNNPAFKGARLVNAPMMAQAGRDLDEIIELSSQVKESSEKLAKMTGTSNSGIQRPRN